MEITLRHSQLEQLLAAVPIGVLIVNEQGNIISANRHIASLLDYTSEELLGLSINKLLPNLELQNVLLNLDEKIREANVASPPVRIETLINPRTEAPFPIDLTLGVLTTSEGPRSVAVIGSPELRQTHAQLVLNRDEQLQVAIESAEIGIWKWHIPSNRLIWDAKMFSLYGLAPTADGIVEYETWSSAVNADDLSRQEQFLQECRRNPINRKIEFLITRRDDNRQRVIEAVTMSQLGPNGATEWIIGSNRDVTEFRRAQHSTAVLSSIISNSDAAVIGKDLNGNITHWNAGAEALFGYPANEILGKNITLLLPPDRLSEEVEIMAKLKRGHAVRLFDTVRRRKDGKLVEVSISVSPMRDTNGYIIGASKIALNIEERRAAERLAERRTVELERSNIELEQFAYIASHDLQEPLRMVASFVALLEQRYNDKIDDKASTYIRFAVDGAKRMQQLIDDLLAYSRLLLTSKDMDFVDLQDCVNTAVTNLANLIKHSNANIRVDSLPKIMGHPSQLLQLFQNLIANALKYRREVAPEIYVRANHVINGTTGWQISVQDNGIGIDPQYFDKIFGIFQRLHSRAQYSGTGIGLAICKRVIQNHSGRIWVESALGTGTTMFLWFPDNEKGL